ncbi:hypothetical protein GGX14DRAFT_406613 [Mycena pura]|uniref:Uncharacterized protein n=1 Tax=Mycena pura TaxID=153505 RepID=A0AAD6UT26_9AGAR|nr:hypothetical protein GGX14DRAFT_406613 [Mycena pura]
MAPGTWMKLYRATAAPVPSNYRVQAMIKAESIISKMMGCAVQHGSAWHFIVPDVLVIAEMACPHPACGPFLLVPGSREILDPRTYPWGPHSSGPGVPTYFFQARHWEVWQRAAGGGRRAVGHKGGGRRAVRHKRRAVRSETGSGRWRRRAAGSGQWDRWRELGGGTGSRRRQAR